jgi:hypothetical protein
VGVSAACSLIVCVLVMWTSVFAANPDFREALKHRA